MRTRLQTKKIIRIHSNNDVAKRKNLQATKVHRLSITRIGRAGISLNQWTKTERQAWNQHYETWQASTPAIKKSSKATAAE
jgi:hypothetical protein